MKQSKSLIAVGVLIISASCMQNDPEIGSDFFNDVSFDITEWDTLTFNMSTVYFDSIITSAPERLLVGNVDHDELGVMSTQTYFQLSPESTLDITAISEMEYQGIALTLYYDDYYYGDTTQLLELEVFALGEELELDDDLALYNLSSFALEIEDNGEPKLLGSVSIYPRPIAKNEIEIELSDELGREFFEYFKSNTVDRNDFLDLMKGVSIQAKGDGVIVGFLTAPVLTIYYKDKSESPAVEKELKFSSGDLDIRFNHIEALREETLLDRIEEEGSISSGLGQKSFVQAGLGLALRIDMPYLKSILAMDEDLLIDGVNLELIVENKVPEEVNMLLSELIVYKVDAKNRPIKAYDASPVLNLDIQYGYDRRYTLDVTEFVTEQIDLQTSENENALMIRFPETQFNNTLDHLIIADQNSEKEKSRIELNVVTIK